MSRSDLMDWVRGVMPFEVRRRSAASWMVPASIGLGLGLAAGIGIGVLVAPCPGHETRRQIKSGAMRLKDRARIAAGNAQQRVRSALGREEQELAEEPRSFLEEGRT